MAGALAMVVVYSGLGADVGGRRRRYAFAIAGVGLAFVGALVASVAVADISVTLSIVIASVAGVLVAAETFLRQRPARLAVSQL